VRPLDAGAYAGGQHWADDLAGVIDATGVERPVRVAWSYGGFVVADYVRAHGEAAIGGIELVGGAVLLRPPSFDRIGPGFLENAPTACDPDLRVSTPAIRRFLGACTACPLDDDVLATALGWNMVVAPEVRAAVKPPAVRRPDEHRQAVPDPARAGRRRDRCPRRGGRRVAARR
jgi:pimeloyl-ACP methyl ester carboxylesterase